MAIKEVPVNQDRPQMPADTDFLKEHRSRVALKGFFGIAQQWGCDEAELAALLGYTDPDALEAFDNGPELNLPTSVLERISLVFGIYRALGTLYPSVSLANEAIRRPRDGSPFYGVSPLAFMIRGDVANLWQTRRYFEAEIQG